MNEIRLLEFPITLDANVLHEVYAYARAAVELDRKQREVKYDSQPVAEVMGSSSILWFVVNELPSGTKLYVREPNHE